MARNSELIRQWEILRDVDSARTGIGIAKLAQLRGVHPRTIRRDVEALARAGFPIYDDRVNGTSIEKLEAISQLRSIARASGSERATRSERAGEAASESACRGVRGAKPLGSYQMGLSTIELCALYFARTTLLAFGAGAMVDDMTRAFMKIEAALPEPTKKFLDRLPMIIKAKALATRKPLDARKTREIVARITDASLSRRRVEMTRRVDGAARAVHAEIQI
jgi:predicted DNA-binding transcriptional regulator YafY